jgi:hypothetical protein
VLTAGSVAAESQRVKFSVTAESTRWARGDSTTLSLVYINQQNTPVVEKVENVTISGTTITFEAVFPYGKGTFGNGLTIAAVTNSTGPFASPDAVAQDTLFGPGLIEIN